MDFNNPFFIWLFFVSIYLVVLSGVFLWFFLRLNRLIKDNDKQGFIKIFEDLIKKEKENIKAVESLRQEVRKNSEEGLAHFQKLGLIRFNPFNETGGNNSFSLALLDGKNNGWVMTGLHTRERTRLYVKPIKNLKSEYELSDEEKKALEKAVKTK
ncbi:MAG: hypothetical protein CH104c_0465 [Candidatus Woesebacteria bacterium]|nr:MAG: hypothetical protein CH104c_0465 [Candidatus Woesebacteria bacterium]